MPSNSFKIKSASLRNKLLNYCEKYDYCFFYDSNAEVNPPSNFTYRSYDFLVGLGLKKMVKINKDNTFAYLESFQNKHKTWLFGYFGYDLKNEIEDLQSNNKDILQLPPSYFIEPQIVITVKADYIQVHALDRRFKVSKIIAAIQNSEDRIASYQYKNTIHAETDKKHYKNTFTQLLNQIALGNIYEVNYCIAFQTKFYGTTNLNGLYHKLNNISKAPFSAYVRTPEMAIISASPERFIKKSGLKIISQPIKGTRKRGENNKEDLKLKKDLENSEKERSENIMITDLVRNDLSIYASRNSVTVEELCGIYSFKQVHQMISTIVAKIKNNKDYINVIKAAFPMGSMTGAPKISAMKIIEKHEQMKRGLYSGALGYISPSKDYDFNVLIRSIFINIKSKKLMYCVGSAVTSKANADEEYNECLIKAKAMMQVLTS
ncbi:MAG: anthranilate synthase component I family protein [Bacteroidia bacterium]|nr:anthranilate synthase component I family protein [Bacteroidia bacterium]MCZ2248668.1 anthranilate synthase component I family protein [Bacteroidia bacterium]